MELECKAARQQVDRIGRFSTLERARRLERARQTPSSVASERSVPSSIHIPIIIIIIIININISGGGGILEQLAAISRRPSRRRANRASLEARAPAERRPTSDRPSHKTGGPAGRAEIRFKFPFAARPLRGAAGRAARRPAQSATTSASADERRPGLSHPPSGPTSPLSSLARLPPAQPNSPPAPGPAR